MATTVMKGLSREGLATAGEVRKNSSIHSHSTLLHAWEEERTGPTLVGCYKVLDGVTRYTPHRRPWRFGHFLQLALTFVHQHFLPGTSVYHRFVPFFSMFQETLQCSEELSWWHGSLVLSPSPLKQEFRNYWRKNSVQQRVQHTRNVNMPHPTPAPAPHPGSCGTSTTCATYKER